MKFFAWVGALAVGVIGSMMTGIVAEMLHERSWWVVVIPFSVMAWAFAFYTASWCSATVPGALCVEVPGNRRQEAWRLRCSLRVSHT